MEKEGFSTSIEAGAEFIHGTLPLTMQLLKEANVTATPIDGEIWQHSKGKFHQQEEFLEGGEVIAGKLKDLETDMSVSDFLTTHFSGDQYSSLRDHVRKFVEGYDAADINRASVAAMASEFAAQEEEQYRINGGYRTIVDYLEQACRTNGCAFNLNSPVKANNWQKGNVEVLTSNGTTYTAPQVLITIPIGILQADEDRPAALSFTPALPQKLSAAKAIGFGPVIKFALEFKAPFWTKPVAGNDLSSLGFLFSEQTIPTWWTQAPDSSTLLTGWLAGPSAKGLANAADEECLRLALHSLAHIFHISQSDLHASLIASHVANWAADPYALGAYTYATVNGQEARQDLLQPVQDTLFFAGEGVYIGPHTGTVEAALQSGLEVSRLILRSKPLKATA